MKWRFRKGKRADTKDVVSRGSSLWAQCESLEYRVFQASGYIEPNPNCRLDEFDHYQSCLFIATGTGDKGPSGVTRLVFNSSRDMNPDYFPTLAKAQVMDQTPLVSNISGKGNETLFIYRDMYDWLMGLSASTCMDVATMAVLPGNRDTRISAALITRIIFMGWERAVRYNLAAIDTPFLEKLRARGLPYKAMGPSVPYWGSPTTPAILDMYQVPKNIKKVLIPLMRLKGIIKEGV